MTKLAILSLERRVEALERATFTTDEQQTMDNALLLAAICAGKARWVPFDNRSGGEVCVGGMCYHTSLLPNQNIPRLNGTIREALRMSL